MPVIRVSGLKWRDGSSHEKKRNTEHLETVLLNWLGERLCPVVQEIQLKPYLFDHHSTKLMSKSLSLINDVYFPEPFCSEAECSNVLYEVNR